MKPTVRFPDLFAASGRHRLPHLTDFRGHFEALNYTAWVKAVIAHSPGEDQLRVFARYAKHLNQLRLPHPSHGLEDDNIWIPELEKRLSISTLVVLGHIDERNRGNISIQRSQDWFNEGHHQTITALNYNEAVIENFRILRDDILTLTSDRSAPNVLPTYPAPHTTVDDHFAYVAK